MRALLNAATFMLALFALVIGVLTYKIRVEHEQVEALQVLADTANRQSLKAVEVSERVLCGTTDVQFSGSLTNSNDIIGLGSHPTNTILLNLGTNVRGER